jgi:SAM-dependent methyltransferase
MSNLVTARMKQTWDALARQNSMHYIATDRDDWDLELFLRSGRDRLFWLLDTLGIPIEARSGTALDLGCGIGRFSFAFAELFDHVIGVDVSEEMIKRAEHLKANSGNDKVEFHCNNGRDIQFIPSASCDFGFSYTVLQHIPDQQIVYGYIGELARVVKPGGQVLFQVLTYQERLPALALRFGLPLFYPILWRAERLGLVPPQQGAAFHGSRLRVRDVEEIAHACGLQIVAVDRRQGSHRFCDETMVLCTKIAGASNTTR